MIRRHTVTLPEVIDRASASVYSTRIRRFFQRGCLRFVEVFDRTAGVEALVGSMLKLHFPCFLQSSPRSKFIAERTLFKPHFRWICRINDLEAGIGELFFGVFSLQRSSRGGA